MIMVDSLRFLLNILVDKYCQDDAKILREIRVILGSDVMVCWEFFKAWEEKVKQIFCCCFSRMMEMEEECFREKFYIYYIKIGVRSLSSNPIVILDDKGINKLFFLFFCTDVVMENEGIEDIEDEKNLKDL